jgi:Abortive infection C-terminus
LSNPNELLGKVERIKRILIARATGGASDDVEFIKLRRELLAEPRIKAKMPGFLKFSMNLGEFWGHIKPKFGTYQERRDYLRDEFLSVLTMLEGATRTPSDQTTSATLAKVDSEHVREAWQKALERRETDPEGAITTARTLIEAVCKHILEKAGVEYEDDWQLPQLYSEAAKQLRLSPSQHSEDIFKQILGGCHSVINGMAGLRNRFSDAHGKGKKGIKPASRHAELAVNLAGSMGTFLIATWEARNAPNPN